MNDHSSLSTNLIISIHPSMALFAFLQFFTQARSTSPKGVNQTTFNRLYVFISILVYTLVGLLLIACILLIPINCQQANVTFPLTDSLANVTLSQFGPADSSLVKWKRCSDVTQLLRGFATFHYGPLFFILFLLSGQALVQCLLQRRQTPIDPSTVNSLYSTWWRSHVFLFFDFFCEPIFPLVSLFLTSLMANYFIDGHFLYLGGLIINYWHGALEANELYKIFPFYIDCHMYTDTSREEQHLFERTCFLINVHGRLLTYGILWFFLLFSLAIFTFQLFIKGTVFFLPPIRLYVSRRLLHYQLFQSLESISIIDFMILSKVKSGITKSTWDSFVHNLALLMKMECIRENLHRMVSQKEFEALSGTYFVQRLRLSMKRPINHSEQ